VRRDHGGRLTARGCKCVAAVPRAGSSARSRDAIDRAWCARRDQKLEQVSDSAARVRNANVFLRANSVRHLTRAIEYEVTRQIAEIERGHVVTKQTRFFDPVRKVTVMGRSKEDEKDYR
jgi:hypothetical protein